MGNKLDGRDSTEIKQVGIEGKRTQVLMCNYSKVFQIKTKITQSWWWHAIGLLYMIVILTDLESKWEYCQCHRWGSLTSLRVSLELIWYYSNPSTSMILCWNSPCFLGKSPIYHFNAYMSILPISSMYGTFTYVWSISMVYVGKYTMHGSYG